MQCDQCNKTAKYNIQKVWVVSLVKKDGDYGPVETLDNQDPIGDDNLHLCRKCALEQFPNQPAIK
jgi:hypothetical protein